MTKTSNSNKYAKTAESINAWREARVQNYARTRSLDALARMVVELEDDGDHPCLPEFEFDEEWPEAVAHLRVK